MNYCDMRNLQCGWCQIGIDNLPGIYKQCLLASRCDCAIAFSIRPASSNSAHLRKLNSNAFWKGVISTNVTINGMLFILASFEKLEGNRLKYQSIANWMSCRSGHRGNNLPLTEYFDCAAVQTWQKQKSQNNSGGLLFTKYTYKTMLMSNGLSSKHVYMDKK